MRSAKPQALRPGKAASGVRQWWLDRTVRTKGLIVVAVPLLTLIAVTVASLMLQGKEQRQRATFRAAVALTTAADQVVADAVNAETAIRGYVATGSQVFLGSYLEARNRLPADLAALHASAAAEGTTQAAARQVSATAGRVMTELARLRAEVSAGTPARSLRAGLLASKATMDTLQAQVTRMNAAPAGARLSGSTAIGQLESAIDVVSYVGLALGLLAGVAGVALFATGISRRLVAAAANAGRLGVGEALVPVPGSRDEIGRLAAALVRADGLLATREAELTEVRDEAAPAIIRRMRDNGAISYLTKPLNLTELGQLLDAHLAAGSAGSLPTASAGRAPNAELIASTEPAGRDGTAASPQPAVSPPATGVAPASGVAFETSGEADADGAPAPAPAHRPGRVRRSGSTSTTGPGA